MRQISRARTAAVALLALAACVPSSPPPPMVGTGSPSDPPGQSPAVVYAAGDIASCDSDGDEATAALLDDLLAGDIRQVLALGDLAYENGSAEDFANCYDPAWGRHRDRTRPVPGNHEYLTSGAAPYFNYFGAAAGSRGDGWYSFDLGGWHLIGLNSNCDEVGGCGSGSDQLEWLEEDLVEHATACTLAFWHHPRWSSGVEHGADDRTDALWRALDDAGAELVLSGHDHQYERFAPLDVDGAADPNGMVQFVVGTGGRPLYEFGTILPTSAAHDNSTNGILKLTLRDGAYAWEFVPTTPGGFTDTGSADCR